MEWVVLLKKFGLPVALVLSLLGSWHFQSRAAYWSTQYDLCQSDRKADQDSFKRAAKAASEANKKTVADTEDHWKGVVADNKKVYDASLQDAYNDVDAYAHQRLRSQTGSASSGSSGRGDVSSTAGTPGVGQGASSSAVVPLVCVPKDDLYIGAENTIKAQQWQTLWAELIKNWPK